LAELNETPKGNRVHVAFFGLRNAGKSTLVNAFTGQDIAIVSDVAGTTTDPVSKAMEILPLGPCLVTDTAGLDDVGELGAMRVEKTLRVLATADIAVWVDDSSVPVPNDAVQARAMFDAECRKRGVTVLEYRRGDSVEELKAKVAAVKLAEVPPGLLDGIAKAGDRVVCVCPIDESAPKGRLILPQVQLVRECLDIGAWCVVCQPRELGEVLTSVRCDLVVTDSQAFGEVRRVMKSTPEDVRPSLTSFSILFARQKGDLAEYVKGLEAIRALADGDRILVAEGCTHHRQCNDIGTVKIPKALSKMSGRSLEFSFSSGGSFDFEDKGAKPALVVQCGGCMLTRREVMRRMAICREAGVPIVNYGMLLAAAHGLNGVRPDGLVDL
jgi:[FeFe] hydrogenase H-cluster maturation GTPase HydF